MIDELMNDFTMYEFEQDERHVPGIETGRSPAGKVSHTASILEQKLIIVCRSH